MPTGAKVDIPAGEIALYWLRDRVAAAEALGQGSNLLVRGPALGQLRLRARDCPPASHRVWGALQKTFILLLHGLSCFRPVCKLTSAHSGPEQEEAILKEDKQPVVWHSHSFVH